MIFSNHLILFKHQTMSKMFMLGELVLRIRFKVRKRNWEFLIFNLKKSFVFYFVIHTDKYTGRHFEDSQIIFRTHQNVLYSYVYRTK